MSWSLTLKKAGLGALTFVTAFLASNPAIIGKMIPAQWADMTVGAAVAAGVVGFTNWLKNRLGK